MRDIFVTETGSDTYLVHVDDNGAMRAYEVFYDDAFHNVITKGRKTKNDVMIASFQFLLERESPNAILPKFDLRDISTYFHDYEEEIRKRLCAGDCFK